MGSRGNIQVIQSDGEVWLYTHWGGYALKESVAAALERGQDRWGDETYLTRILFCSLLNPDDLYATTGFGIGCSIGDNEYPVVVVNCNERSVTIDGQQWSFGQFMNEFGGG